MIQTTTRIALEVVAGVLAVVVLLVGLAFWRLSTGPVQLDFVTPRIEEALSDPKGGLSVQIGTTELTWGGWARTVDLHARDVRVRDRTGALVAALPDAVVRLSLRALVQGIVAPTAVELIGARVSLRRDQDGAFQFGRWGEAGEPLAEDDLSQMLPSVIKQLMAPPAPVEPLSFLTAVRIMGGRVTVRDRKLGRVWHAPWADIELRRDAAGLAGAVELELELAGTQADIGAGFVYDKALKRIDLGGTFTDVRPEAIGSLVPPLAPLGGLSMPLDGSLSASLDASGVLDSLHFEVTGGAGELNAPGLLTAPLALRAVSAAGRVSGPDHRLKVTRAQLLLGTGEAPGPEVTASGALTSAASGFAGDLAIDAALEARGVALAELERYWPVGVGGASRAWVLANIPQGTVEHASAQLSLRVPDGVWAETELGALDGTLRFRDLEVHFLRPLPPVVAIDGTARYDAKHITFSPQRGHLGSLQVRPSTVHISDLDTSDERMSIDLAVTGPLDEALALLDHERLGLVRRLGFDPAGAEGQVAARLEFRFPLIKGLTLEQLDVAARANLEQVGLAEFLLGKDASEGRLALELDNGGMTLSGPLRLGGVPLDIVWSEAFREAAEPRRRLEVRAGRIDDSSRRVFGLDLAPYLQGPVSASILVLSDHAGRDTVKAALNLQEARLAIAPLDWEKAAGVPGEAYLTLVLDQQRLSELRALEVRAGTLRARGRGRFDPAGRRLASLTFDELAFETSRLNDVAVDLAGDGAAVRIGGGVLDARLVIGEEGLDEAASPAAAGERGGDPGPAGGSAEASAAPDHGAADGPADEPAKRPPYEPLALSAQGLDAVYFADDRYFEGVDLELVRSPRGWERVWLLGQVPRELWLPAGLAAAAPPAAGPRTLKIDFRPAPEGGKLLSITAEDMGAVLRALDALDTVIGGRLEITGQSPGPMPFGPLTVQVEAQDYVLIDAPRLARILTVASLTGVNDLLRGEGIRFSRLVGEVVLQDGTLRTDLLRAYGPALGITAKGEIDLDRATSDLQGTVVPAYTVNRILGEIPLLGPILTGGEGEGVFAVTYRMTGPLDEPQVSVDPLSALAPGFLRALFSASPDGERPSALPPRHDP